MPQLDEQARKYLYELMGPRTTEALMHMPGGIIEEVIKTKIQERGRIEQSRPRFNSVLHRVI